MITQPAWRLILNLPDDGSWNMAVDEAIFESCLSLTSLPTLRLYAWQPACLSLGYSQPFSDVDSAAVQKQGWQIVRRPTGGRAILHIDELTYSICGRVDNPALSGSLLESYSRISQALQLALNLLGIHTQAEEKYPLADGSDPKGVVCFEVPSNYEITSGGKKLIGSAQLRRKGGLLQHGSLPLTGDLSRITRALCFQDEQSRTQTADRVLLRAVTAETLTGRNITWGEAAEAFTQAFSHHFGITFNRSELTPDEIISARHLETIKYQNPVWTERL